MSQPNVLFVFTDDQRFDTIYALGNADIETPNFDRLVRQGTSFTHAHIMGGTCGAVCIPCRAMMLTGRTLFSIEKQGHSIPQEHITLPEHFRACGYSTMHIGKWHQDISSHVRSFSDGARIFGFNRQGGWYEACNGHWHIPVHDFDPGGTYDVKSGYNDPCLEPFRAPFETVKDRGRHSAEIFTDSAVEFINGYPESCEAEAGKPFFLYLAHLAPHDPRQYPPRFRRKYRAESVSLPENFAPRHPFDNGELLIRDELLEAFPRRPDAILQHIADYYAIISLVDEQLGRILNALEESGQSDNTIIVFAGDNGLAVGQHGLMGKQNLYDHSVRVPLIFSGPGIPSNQGTDALCYLLDIFPTLCELTGLTVPDTVEGKSLAGAIRSPSAAVRDTLHFAYKDTQRAVRNNGFKLIEYAVEGRRRTQLFNLETDPFETENLARSKEHSQVLERMREELKRWPRALGDTREMGDKFWSQFDS